MVDLESPRLLFVSSGLFLSSETAPALVTLSEETSQSQLEALCMSEPLSLPVGRSPLLGGPPIPACGGLFPSAGQIPVSLGTEA